MKNFIRYIDRYTNLLLEQAKGFRKDKNALIFLVFLFISSCFWVLNALSKDSYTAELKYPIRLTNAREGELIKGSARRDLKLRVKGGGFSLLKYQFGHSFVIDNVDITNLPRVRMQETEGVILSTKEYMVQIESKLANGMHLVEIEPDTLFIPLAERVNRKVAIRLNAEISYAQQHQSAGMPLLWPDSVMVSGPRRIVDTIRFIQTKRLAFIDLKDSTKNEVGLETYNQIELGRLKTQLTLPVERYTESSVLLNVTSIGLPDSLLLKPFPSKVKLSFRVGMSRRMPLPSEFKVAVDCKGLNPEALPARLKVRLMESPSHITHIDIAPLFVEYLLERRNQHNK